MHQGRCTLLSPDLRSGEERMNELHSAHYMEASAVRSNECPVGKRTFAAATAFQAKSCYKRQELWGTMDVKVFLAGHLKSRNMASERDIAGDPSCSQGNAENVLHDFNKGYII